jgi:hypothetical protein
MIFMIGSKIRNPADGAQRRRSLENTEANRVECARALRDADCLPAQVVSFLAKRGCTEDTLFERGGWMPILIEMVPGEYPTYTELAEAIRADG